MNTIFRPAAKFLRNRNPIWISARFAFRGFTSTATIGNSDDRKVPPSRDMSSLSARAKTDNLNLPELKENEGELERRLQFAITSKSPNKLPLSSSVPIHAVKTVNNGRSVSIGFHYYQSNEIEESIFHAPWLWINDPNFIHPTSGQKLRTPGQYRQANIKIAAVDIVDEITLKGGINVVDNESSLSLHPAPPAGSIHPIGGLYKPVFSSSADNSQHQDENSIRQLLQVTWEHDNSALSSSALVNDEGTTLTKDFHERPRKGHVSFYDVDWLARCRHDTSELRRRSQERRITKDMALGSHKNPSCRTIKSIDYRDLMIDSQVDEKDSEIVANPDYILETLDAIMEQGAVLIKNSPNVAYGPDCTVGRVGKSLSSGGMLSHGALYGDIFHVISSPDAHNIAYTSNALPPHQDLTYYESKPFLQLLHCISNAINTNQDGESGESVLVDAMAAAEEFRVLAPDLFQILLECEACFIKQREGADMVSCIPHIQTSSSGGDVIAVNWSPPFEGGPISIPSHLLEDYFVAYSAFELMLDNTIPDGNPNTTSPLSQKLSPDLEVQLREYARNYTWEYKLKPGDILIFNNSRMVHGRRAFSIPSPTSSNGDDATPASRHLVGCYTGAMETLSRYRELLRSRTERDGRMVRNAGNSTPGSP